MRALWPEYIKSKSARWKCRIGMVRLRISGLIQDRHDHKVTVDCTRSLSLGRVWTGYMRGMSLREERLPEGQHGAATQKRKKAREVPGRGGLGRGLMCLDDIIQQHSGESLGQRPPKAPAHYLWWAKAGCSCTGYAKQVGSKWLKTSSSELYWKQLVV